MQLSTIFLPFYVVIFFTTTILTVLSQEPEKKLIETTLETLNVQRGELLFTDDFNRAELGNQWIEHFKAGSIQNESLVVNQPPEEHPGVIRHLMSHRDSIYQFEITLSDISKRGLLVVNGAENAHIFHLSFVNTPKHIVVSLKDYAAPQKDIISKKIAKKQTAYNVTVIHIGTRIEAIIDNQLVLTLDSPTLSNKKELFQFNGVGEHLVYDNVKVWDLEPSQ